MRILVVGASGLLGSAVVDALQDRHEVLKASRNGELKVDIGEQADRQWDELMEKGCL